MISVGGRPAGLPLPFYFGRERRLVAFVLRFVSFGLVVVSVLKSFKVLLGSVSQIFQEVLMNAYVELHIGESSYWEVRTPLPELHSVMIPLPDDQSPFSAAVASAFSVVVLVAIMGCDIVFPSTPGGIRAAWVFLKPKRCERLERARQQALRRASDFFIHITITSA